eukprot:TRINITY_DN40289_c0_g1_i1.p1 TRINITY_DN40289_c0_g1~~TRINITY_DN40289_c0_g1_i1.p1  ORF type:complete len:349 (+),score=58.07 TRINITY_DN40289_c0_g1_i1:340-1386(+)
MALLVLSVFLAFGATFQAFPLKSFSAQDNDQILKGHLINEINSFPNVGWKAGSNARFSNYTVGEFKRLLGARKPSKKMLERIPVKTFPKGLDLPKSYDAREAYPQCRTINEILDQGHCGSCWAFGATEALSDRFCIHYNLNVTLSENDILACCGIMCGDGCDGGYPLNAWQYFVQKGVVTAECDPYFDQTGCKHPGCDPLYPTPKCVKQCKNGNQDWNMSKHYAESAYKINSNQYDIMAEVYRNGPVEVDFDVYEDFAHYKSGVYKYVKGDYMGGHAVKLIGWGTTQDGVDYWLIVNSWNKSWGENGLFKIVRGTNECGIEEDAVAGMPSTKNLLPAVMSFIQGHASW